MGLTLPEQFDEKGLFGLATQLIGLNAQTFKEVLVKKLGAGGERIVAALEKGEEVLGEATELFRILKTEGLGGLWTHLKEMILRHLSETFNRIKETVLYETIKKALMFVASLFTPVGAFIKAVQLLYAGLKFLMDNIERIAMLVNAFLDSLELAVKGDTGSIANKIITVLSTFIVIGIDFLAKLLNLGNLADKVRKIIQALRAPVLRAMEWLVDRLIKPALEAAKKAGKAVAQAGVPQDPNERLRLGLDAATTAVNALRAPVVTAALIHPVLTVIKVRYGFKTLQPVEIDGVWWVEGEVNPRNRQRSLQAAAAATGQPVIDWTKKLAHAGDPGTIGDHGPRHGVFEGWWPGVKKPVAIKVFPKHLKDNFDEVVASTKAAEASGGPKFYGVVSTGDERHAFAMEKIKGSFTMPAPRETATRAERKAIEREAEFFASKVTHKTVRDLEIYSARLLNEGRYIMGEVQGFVNAQGRWRPIDIGGIRWLPRPDDPSSALNKEAIEEHESNVRMERNMLQALAEENERRRG
jgi:hypothetical protein